MGILYLSAKFELYLCTDDGDLLSDRKKTGNKHKQIHTHRLKLILTPYRIYGRLKRHQQTPLSSNKNSGVRTFNPDRNPSDWKFIVFTQDIFSCDHDYDK